MADNRNGRLSLELRGEILAEDISLAKAVHRRGSRMWMMLAIVVSLLAALVITDAMIHGNERHPGIVSASGTHEASSGDVNETVKLALFLAPVVIGVLAIAFFLPRLPWHPHETIGCPVKRVITGEGIRIDDATMQGYVPWDYVVRYRTSDTLCILYTRTTPAVFILPRRLFSQDEDWKEFRELLSSRVISAG